MTSVSAVEIIKAGKIRALAVASDRRIPQLPDLPTMAEAGVAGFESDSWNGIFAPRGTPADVVARLQAEISKAVAAPDLRDRLMAQGGVLVGNTQAEFRSFIKQEVEHWGQVFQTTNVKAE
jgi:tripartite-type tricarboxylate transporter receptor subunit TctC